MAVDPLASATIPSDQPGDLDPQTFRAAAHAVVDLMADYLEHVEDYPVLPPVKPGDLRGLFPADPPQRPEPLGAILADYRVLVEPNVTHWQHPSFFAYFASSASGPGILGEMLMATLVGNAMLWRTSPVATELEQVTVDWLRSGLDLPPEYAGFYTDTASTSSLIALAAARQAVPGRDRSADGIGPTERLRVYASSEAHSSIEKAAMTIGIGRAGLRRIESDADYRMVPAVLERAIEADRADGWTPCAIVATIGTTSSTSIDPTAELATIAEREGLWLHVDAAYAGAAALCPEYRPLFAGWERADSIVVNPHKWLFTPLDCSLFLSRRLDTVRDAFSLVPEYLRSSATAQGAVDFNEYTPQLGRRFRALKMWFILRAFGLDGLRHRIRTHCAWATEFARWVDTEPRAERLAPVPFSTVCFRWLPRTGDVDAFNERLLGALNASGALFLSHTRLADRYTLRIALGHLRTRPEHVRAAWERIVTTAGALESGDRTD